jgi:Predicted phosphatase
MPARPLNTPLAEIAATRRETLKGLLGGTALALLPAAPALAVGTAEDPSSLTFVQPEHVIGDDHKVAPGHRAQVLIRWGDTVESGAPAFDPATQTPAAQERQFGYNNDFVAFLPLPVGSNNSDHGLLCVNHEYTNAELMFPGITLKSKVEAMTREQVDVEIAAHGHAVVEVRRDGADWTVVPDSPFNRRISALTTPMAVSGPAAGHDRLKTKADPTGRSVIGTLNNCAGGVTPWGTVLIAEENIDTYFSGSAKGTAEEGNHERMGIKGKSRYAWSRFHDRFDVTKELNEPNRFGWVVEIDPYDPTFVPVKRTALGRFKHEAANTVLLEDGRVVVYCGDDEVFEYLYRFVTRGKVDRRNRLANLGLLDEGVLSVARFDQDGGLTWLPLVHGRGPLTAANGFHSQADVVIEARRAADLVGATPMDRPEDVEANPANGRVYVMLTNNSQRKPEQVGGPHPRAKNAHGHVVELIPPGAGKGRMGRHDADRFRWDILLLAGRAEDGARYHPLNDRFGVWMSSPDNCAFDNRGRLWISSDQGSNQRRNGIPDGMYACDVDGRGRALLKLFYACPRDAEMCGPAFTPDNRTLFVAVQHPGEDKDSTFDDPSTRWPDFRPGMPPRPAVVAITRADDRPVGG